MKVKFVTKDYAFIDCKDQSEQKVAGAFIKEMGFVVDDIIGIKGTDEVLIRAVKTIKTSEHTL
jgi:hypothetical protein